MRVIEYGAATKGGREATTKMCVYMCTRGLGGKKVQRGKGRMERRARKKVCLNRTRAAITRIMRVYCGAKNALVPLCLDAGIWMVMH